MGTSLGSFPVGGTVHRIACLALIVLVASLGCVPQHERFAVTHVNGVTDPVESAPTATRPSARRTAAQAAWVSSTASSSGTPSVGQAFLIGLGIGLIIGIVVLIRG